MIITAYKPVGISSNHYLNKLKKKYGTKKAGFSGTLDPFAKGSLVVAFNESTKLLPYLKLSPKRYIATLWLGAFSETLDIERVTKVDILPKFCETTISLIIQNLINTKEIVPPKFSAKRVGGKRAYELARRGTQFELNKMQVEIFKANLLCYRHPFVSFDISVSKGTYIRTIGDMIAKQLKVNGALCSLERVSEGDFYYKNEAQEDILKVLNLKQNRINLPTSEVLNGKKLTIDDCEIKEFGEYLAVFESFFSIIRINDCGVSYILNARQRG